MIDLFAMLSAYIVWLETDDIFKVLVILILGFILSVLYKNK